MGDGDAPGQGAELQRRIEDELRAARERLVRRLEAIQGDRRRVRNPLERDADDQAIQRENDEALDALDARGRQELDAIDAALARLAEGTFGTCVRCRGTIAPERLRARPEAGTCRVCAERERS